MRLWPVTAESMLVCTFCLRPQRWVTFITHSLCLSPTCCLYCPLVKCYFCFASKSKKKQKSRALKNTEDSSVKSDGLCQHREDRVKNISFLHWNCSARAADRQLSSYRRKSARLLTATFMRQPLACYFCSINSRLQFCEVDKPVTGDFRNQVAEGLLILNHDPRAFQVKERSQSLVKTVFAKAKCNYIVMAWTANDSNLTITHPAAEALLSPIVFQAPYL